MISQEMLIKLQILKSKVNSDDTHMLELIQIFIDEIESDIASLKDSTD